jgi:excisionase family DNA binding protein
MGDQHDDLLNAKLLLTRQECAHLMSISLRTLDELLAVGEIASCRIGRRRLIARRELERFTRSDHAIPGKKNDQR